MSADHLQNGWFECVIVFFSISLLLHLLTTWATSHRYFGTCICTILQIYASSQSANNQFLKIQVHVTRTPCQIWIFKNQYLRILLTGFSNIDNAYADNRQIMQKWWKLIAETVSRNKVKDKVDAKQVEVFAVTASCACCVLWWNTTTIIH